MSELIALLDPPANDSMGAVPVVTRESDGGMFVRGLAHSHRRPISLTELNELLSSRQAISTDPIPVDFPDNSNPVAMWVGEAFAESANRLGMPPAPARDHAITIGRQGHAVIGSSDEIYARLEVWLERAFRKVIEGRNHSLASLMAQTLPNHPLTQAALWHSAPSDAKRANELAWFRRLRIDAGKREEAQTLERQFEELCRRPPWASVKAVILMSGLAGSGHTKASQRFAQSVSAAARGLSLVSFGDFLREEFQKIYREVPSKPQLQVFGQRFVVERPYRFVQRVLTQAKLDLQPAVLVVDGVRHQIIKDAIEFIVNKPLTHYFVNVPEGMVVKNLEREVGRERVRDVQQADTEVALHTLMVQIPESIEYDGSANLDTKTLDAASRWVREKQLAVS